MNVRLVAGVIGFGILLSPFAFAATAVRFLPLSFALTCSSETPASSRLLVAGSGTSQTCIDEHTRTGNVRIEQVAVVRDKYLNGIYEVVIRFDSTDAAHVLPSISAQPPRLLAVIVGDKVVSIAGATKPFRSATIWLGGYPSQQAASFVAKAFIQPNKM